MQMVIACGKKMWDPHCHGIVESRDPRWWYWDIGPITPRYPQLHGIFSDTFPIRNPNSWEDYGNEGPIGLYKFHGHRDPLFCACRIQTSAISTVWQVSKYCCFTSKHCCWYAVGPSVTAQSGSAHPVCHISCSLHTSVLPFFPSEFPRSISTSEGCSKFHCQCRPVIANNRNNPTNMYKCLQARPKTKRYSTFIWLGYSIVYVCV